MTDVLSKKQRSYCMSRIRGVDTKPELIVRKAVFAAGVRGYRFHQSLPGKPDMVFPKRRIVIFVDGCFWHKCPACFTEPATNRGFWRSKINSNTKRDRLVDKKLKEMGWKVIRVWEHESRNQNIIRRKVIDRVKNA